MIKGLILYFEVLLSEQWVNYSSDLPTPKSISVIQWKMEVPPLSPVFNRGG